MAKRTFAVATEGLQEIGGVAFLASSFLQHVK